MDATETDFDTDPIVQQAVLELLREIKLARSQNLFGSVKLAIYFRNGKTHNAECDRHRNLRPVT